MVRISQPLVASSRHPLPGGHPGAGNLFLRRSRDARITFARLYDPAADGFPNIRSHLNAVRVPVVGPDDNELGMLMLPSVAVPLATYTGWNLRHRSIGAENELLSLTGGYIPFVRTAAEAQAAGDPRPSIESLYRDFDDYRQRDLAVVHELIDQRYVLPEEMPRFEQAVERHREFFSKR